MISKLFWVIILTVVLFSLQASAFEINDSGVDFSVKDQFSVNIYFENLTGEKTRIKSNNDFGYFNRFTELDGKTTKWDLVFDRTGRSDILKIVVVIPNATIEKNTVFIKDYSISFEDAIEQGFIVELNSLGKDAQVSISNFSEIFGPITIDPTIVDSSPLSLTNYGNAIVKDSSGNIFTVQEVVTDGGSNTDIFISKSTDEGLTFTSFNLTNSPDVNELLPHIDINSTDGLMIEFDCLDGNRNIYVTTCSTGGCDSNAEFLDKLNVSDCGSTSCANGNIVHDQNGTSHISYAHGESSLRYRSNSGFVGDAWGAEETVGSVGGGAITGRDGTGILIANNGDGTKIVFTNANGAQANIGFFNGTLWSPTVLELASVGVAEPLGGFAGYDGNFYITYSKQVSGADASKQIHYRQCITDCNILGNWSTDVNVTDGGLNLAHVSLFQSSDLNVNIIASSLVSAADANLFHFVRTPNNIFTTSNIADGNLLFSDANRTYNPLVRNRGYDGSVLGLASLPTLGNIEIDYVFLTSNNAQGDPSTLIFDSNSYPIANGILTSFTTNPVSPIAIDPEEGITNILADFNSTTEFFPPGVIVDINFLWQINGEEISTDENTVRDFNGADADFNVSLIVSGNDGGDTFTSQQDQNILFRSAPQGVDFNFTNNAFANNVDVNFRVFATGTINFAVWGGTDFDTNVSGTNINKTFDQNKITQVCVIVNGSGDVNKLVCKDFIVARWLVSPAIDEETEVSLTPTITNYNNPNQTYTHSADINVFTFYGPEVNYDTNAAFLIDFNTSYFTRNYFFDLDKNITFFLLQPRLPLVANSIQSTLFTIDNFTRDTVPEIVIQAIRTIAGEEVIIESTISDSTGTATMSFVANLDYTLRFLDADGKILSEGPLGPKSTVLYAFIGTAEINFVLTPVGELVIQWIPNASSIDANTNFTVRFNQIINQVDLNITTLTVRISQGDTNFFVQDFNFLGTDTNIFQDVNVLDANEFSFMIVTITAQTPDGNFTKEFSYILVFTAGGSLVKNIQSLKTELGPTVVLIIAVIITLFTIAGFAKVATTDFNWLGLVALFVLGIFTYFLWIPLTIYLVAILMGGAGLIYRWVR